MPAARSPIAATSSRGRSAARSRRTLATDAFRSLRTTLKINASLHDLRHTAATWMLAGGIDVKTVASASGPLGRLDDAQRIRARDRRG